jgi:hypothetical protein
LNFDDYDPQGYSEPAQEPESLRRAYGRQGFGISKPAPVKTPTVPRYSAPERRAREYGYSFNELATVGRWLGPLLEQCPKVKDCLSFWRSCQVLAWIAEPIETQEALAARLGVSQQYISKLVVKISERLSAISTL